MTGRNWILLGVGLILVASCRPEAQSSSPDARGLAVMLRDAIAPCWNERVSRLTVTEGAAAINVRTMPDGSVESVRPTEPDRLDADPELQAVADAAMAAIIACSPLPLPRARYEDWRDVVLTFRVGGAAGS